MCWQVNQNTRRHDFVVTTNRRTYREIYNLANATFWQIQQKILQGVAFDIILFDPREVTVGEVQHCRLQRAKERIRIPRPAVPFVTPCTLRNKFCSGNCW